MNTLYYFIATHFGIVTSMESLPAEWQETVKEIKRREAIYNTPISMIGRVDYNPVSNTRQVNGLGDVFVDYNNGGICKCYHKGAELIFPLVADYASDLAKYNCFILVDRVNVTVEEFTGIDIRTITGRFIKHRVGYVDYSIVVHPRDGFTLLRYSTGTF